MEDNLIENLKAAIAQSPDNHPLKILLGETYLKLNRLTEAEETFKSLISQSNDKRVKIGLAKTFFQKGNFSACNVILEEVLDTGNPDIDTLSLYAKALLKENDTQKAIEVYKRALQINPDFYDDELDSELRMKDSQSSNAFEDDDLDSRFLSKPDVDFSDVGGMENVKKEIELKIIKPLQHPELYKAYGKKMGGGILLYGPPGCGKTFIAKATAGQVKAKFISIGLNDILDMWVGSSEKNLHEIFELARSNTPCVLFIDEIDALGASRSDMKQSSGRHLINQFLQELDGIDSSNDGLLVLGASNTPWNLDPAFRRPGRFDRIVFVPPPDEGSRAEILKLKLREKPIDSIDFNKLAKKTEKFSGADIDAIIDIAIEAKLESAFVDGIPKPLNTKDLLESIKRHNASTQEWFMTAKNFAMFANDSGLYDDILTYLNIKK